MTDGQAFWTRVHAALDARRDPLEDPGVLSWIGEHPEDALELARLRRGLSALAAERPANADDNPLWLAAAAALLLGLLLVGWGARPDDRAQAAEEAAVAASSAPPAPRVHSFRVRVSTASEGGSSTVLVDGRGVERRRELQHGGTTLKLSSTSQHGDAQ